MDVWQDVPQKLSGPVLLRFNDTRANEDTGFNTLVKALTRRYKFIPQTVYLWHYKPDSITRRENGLYAYDAGHRGYVENMIWAISEMRRRGLNKEIVRKETVTVLCRLYHMHMELCYRMPMYAEESLAAIQRYYDACCRPIEDMIPAVYLQETFLPSRSAAGIRRRGHRVMTFQEFISRVRKERGSAMGTTAMQIFDLAMRLMDQATQTGTQTQPTTRNTKTKRSAS